MQDKLNEFITYLKVERNCSPKTLDSYKTDIEKFFSSVGIVEPNQITKYRIRDFLGNLVDEGMEATTRNRKLTAIRSFCKYLVKEGYIENNPTVDIPYANTNKKLPQTITIEQTVDILDSADSLRDRAVLETMYGTGCRVGELVAIRLIDFNLDGKIIRLFGKGRKERIVPLSQGAVDAIKKYVDSRNDRSQYLFPSPNNKYEKDNFIDNPITTRAMYNIVSKYGDANNVSMSPHKFRHSFATHLLSGDVDIRTIQQLLGHANINTTTIYAQVAIDKMSTEFHRAHPRG